MKDPSDIPDGWLLVEIDGPGVSPATINGHAAMRVATAYLDLIVALAKAFDHTGVAFGRGLKVIDKCAAIAVPLAEPGNVHELALRGLRLLRRQDSTPDGVESYVVAVRRSLRLLPPDQRAKARTRTWVEDIDATNPQALQAPWSRTTIRATLTRVGGENPRARFEARMEPEPFILDVLDKGLAQQLARSLYREVDLDARILRGADGQIVDGELVDFHFVTEAEDATDAWVSWMDLNAPSWKSVADIEGELDRGD